MLTSKELKFENGELKDEKLKLTASNNKLEKENWHFNNNLIESQKEFDEKIIPPAIKK